MVLYGLNSERGDNVHLQLGLRAVSASPFLLERVEAEGGADWGANEVAAEVGQTGIRPNWC